MSFNKFTWVDRSSEYPSRRTITDTSTGVSQVATIVRNEGTVTEQGTPFNATNMNSLENRIDAMFPLGTSDMKTSEIIDLIYPVGAIYMSVDSTSPQTLFGGTWEQIQDTFLLASGTTYTSGSTGGSATHTHTTADHTLIEDEMPSHTHGYKNADDNSNTDYWCYTASYRKGATWYVENTGGGQAHNHGDTGSSSSMPPYLAVYVWKRTA